MAINIKIYFKKFTYRAIIPLISSKTQHMESIKNLFHQSTYTETIFRWQTIFQFIVVSRNTFYLNLDIEGIIHQY